MRDKEVGYTSRDSVMKEVETGKFQIVKLKNTVQVSKHSLQRCNFTATMSGTGPGTFFKTFFPTGRT